jgi:hypothetical protein
MASLELSAEQIRVLGCLLEKQRTTPDAYPLSLNALRLACNQSTNRDPVVDYDEAELRDALHRLERRGLVRLASGNRAAKYRHLLAEALPMDSAEQAVMCVLMLRGPQTPGELKQRADRMHVFPALEDVQATLTRLIERELVVRLARRPGQKEERYEQLLRAVEDDDERRPGNAQVSVPVPVVGPPPGPTPTYAPTPTHAPAGSLAALELRVEGLERELTELRTSLASRNGAGAGEASAP